MLLELLIIIQSHIFFKLSFHLICNPVNLKYNLSIKLERTYKDVTISQLLSLNRIWTKCLKIGCRKTNQIKRILEMDIDIIGLLWLFKIDFQSRQHVPMKNWQTLTRKLNRKKVCEVKFKIIKIQNEKLIIPAN